MHKTLLKLITREDYNIPMMLKIARHELPCDRLADIGMIASAADISLVSPDEVYPVWST